MKATLSFLAAALVLALLAPAQALAIPVCHLHCTPSSPPTTPCWCPDFRHTSTCGLWEDQCLFFAPAQTSLTQETPLLELPEVEAAEVTEAPTQQQAVVEEAPSESETAP